MNIMASKRSTPLSRKEIASRARASLLINYRKVNEIPADELEAFGYIAPAFALEQLGFRVVSVDGIANTWNQGFHGEVAASMDRDASLIEVSSRCTVRELRFTLAHELGHLVLQPEFTGVHRERRLDGPAPRKDWFEREADIFAAQFLMPERLLRNEFLVRFGVETFVLTENSAMSAFGVSCDKVLSKAKGTRGLALALAQCSGPVWNSFVPLDRAFRVSALTMAIQLEDLGMVAAPKP